MFRKKSLRIIAFALAVCLICSAITSMIQSSGGQVEVTERVIETSYGPLGLMILQPKTATLQDPAPCVIACHGSYNSKEMQSPAMVELSRRGIVVVSIDMFCHGHSANAESLHYIDNHNGGYYNVETGEFVQDKTQATAVNAHGIIEAVEYVYSCLGYVDREKIGVTGHSMGAVSSTNAVRYYHNVSSLLGEPQKITSAFFQSCTELTYPGEFDNFDIGYVIGDHDEMQVLNMGFDPTLAERGITTVPAYIDDLCNQFITRYTNYTGSYAPGSFVHDDAGNLRVYNIETGTHPTVHFSKACTADMISFFCTSFGIDTALSPDNQLWFTKEVISGIGLLSFFVLLYGVISLLLQSRFFVSIAPEKDIPALAPPKTNGERVFYFVMLVLLAILPGQIYYTSMNADILHKSDFFPQICTNHFSVWVTLAGLILIAGTALGYWIFGKRSGATLKDYGVSLPKGNSPALAICKYLLLPIIAAAVVYAFLFVQNRVFHTDYRFWEFAVKTFTFDHVQIVFRYLPFYLVWGLGLTVAVNASFRQGWPEIPTLVLCTALNLFGCVLPMLTYYVPFFQHGMPNSSEFINPILMINVLPMIVIATVLSRCLYKKSGAVWLPATTLAVIFCFATVVNTTHSNPYWFF